MKKLILTILFFGLLIGNAFAANRYVNNNSCTYNGDGTTWACAASDGAAGAFNDLPFFGTTPCGYDAGSWIKGDTYYIAGGAAAYQVSCMGRNYTGTGDITLKKATVADHGGQETGWSNAYGTDQAILSGVMLYDNNITIDGVYRTDATSGYGIKFTGAGSVTFIRTANNKATTGATLRYLEFTHTSYDTNAGSAIFLYGNGDNLIEYVYAHDLAGLCFKGNIYPAANPTGGFENIVITDSVCGRIGRTTGTAHVELIKDDGYANNVVIKNNIFYDWRSTGGIILSQGQNNWTIHTNIFSQRTAGLTCGNGVIAGLDSGTSGYTNIKVYNNTFANVTSLCSGVFGFGGDFSGTGNEVINNLFYNIDTNPNTCAEGCTNGTNWYYDVPLYTPTGTEIAGGGNPFTDAPNEDFTLNGSATATNPIDAGTTVAINPAVDFIGTGRPQDGGGGALWDIGAYEYLGGVPPADYTAPTIDTLSVAPTSTGGVDVVVTYTCSDDTAVTVERYDIGTPITLPTDGSAASSPQTVAIGELSVGNNQIWVGCCDAANNCGSAGIWVQYALGGRATIKRNY